MLQLRFLSNWKSWIFQLGNNIFAAVALQSSMSVAVKLSCMIACPIKHPSRLSWTTQQCYNIFINIFSDRREYRIIFRLVNTLGKTIVLTTPIPSYRTVTLVPGEVFTLNTTVATQRPIFINVLDPATNQRARINGKTVHVVFPKLTLVPYTGRLHRVAFHLLGK